MFLYSGYEQFLFCYFFTFLTFSYFYSTFNRLLQCCIKCSDIVLSLANNVVLKRYYYVCFTARCYAFAVLAMALCPSVCLCVCPSVRPSQVGVLLKRLNVGSHKQHYVRQSRDSSFLKPKISAKFDRDHPLQGRQMQVGWVKIVDFRQIAGYISKTVQDRRMVSIKVE